MTLEAVPLHVVVEGGGVGGSGTLVVRVRGELDMYSRESIETAVMAAVVSADAVVVDLEDLTFCDSTGVSLFVAVREKAVAEGTSLAFRNVVGNVRTVFALSGVDAIFDLIE